MKILIVGILILCFILLSCNENCNDPNQNQNNPPEISDIILTPANPKTNQTVILNAVASDRDGDILTYNWSVTDGEIDGTGIGNPINWTTPSSKKSVDITCIISDGKETSSLIKRITVEVEIGMVKGYVLEKGTNNPINQAHIIIENRDANSGSNGYYELKEIEVGERIIWAIRSGYKTYSDTILVITGDNPLDIYLESE